MLERLSSLRRQTTRSSRRGSSSPKHQDTEGNDNIDKTSQISSPRYDTATLAASDAQRRDHQSRTQVTTGSTRLGEDHLASMQGSGRDIQSRDDDIPTEQESSKNTGGTKAKRTMDELNKLTEMEKKIAELQQQKLQKKRLQQQKLKQQGSDIEKHLEEQRALEERLGNQNAEIDRLQRDLSEKDEEIYQLRASLERWQQEAGKTLEERCALEVQLENRSTEIDHLRRDLSEKDEEMHQLRASLERLRQEKSTGIFSNARDFSVENPIMTDVKGDFHLHTDREKRVLDELPIATDGMYDSLSRFNPSFCHPGTRERVLEEITDWVDNSDPDKGILWVNGLGGTGKSTIAQTIIKRYKKSRIAATFFFLKGHADCGHAGRLFTTLAWQMAKSIPETRPHIESVLKTHRLAHTQDLDAQFYRLFVDVFGRVPDLRPEKSLIVIDGIDELSSERQQTHLLRLIGDKLASPGIPLRFIFFSRPETHIEEIFGKDNMSKITQTLSLDRYEPKEDIRKYLTEKFRDIFTTRRARIPTDGDIDSLVSKSPRQFIFASTVVSFIGDDGFAPQEQLRFLQRLRVTEDSPFALMDQLYMEILSQQKDTKMLRDLFVLLIALGHPTLLFVSRRLGIREKQLRLKLRAMRALVHITNSNIGAYHRALHDFFLDKQRSKQYYIHPIRIYLVQLSQKRCISWERVSAPNAGGGSRNNNK